MHRLRHYTLLVYNVNNKYGFLVTFDGWCDSVTALELGRRVFKVLTDVKSI